MRFNLNSLSVAYLSLIVAMVFWGISFVAVKIALESFPTFTLLFARYSLASCFLFVLLARRGFPLFTRKEKGKVLLIALFDPGLFYVFVTIGLQYTSATKTSLIIATIPLAVMVFAAIFLDERTELKGIFGIGLSIVGIAILITGDPQVSWVQSGTMLGDLLIFGGVISAAFYTVCVRDLAQRHSGIEITSMQIIFGIFFYAPISLCWELPDIQWSAFSGRSLGALVYLALFCTIGAYLCYNHALSKIPAARAAVFTNISPVITALGAWILLGEKLTLMQAAGGALILFAVFLTNLPNDRVNPTESG